MVERRVVRPCVAQVCEFLCGALGLAREDVRLWSVGAAAVLLDDERPTLYGLRLDERPRLLLELRNADLTWPEEIGALGYLPHTHFIHTHTF